MATASGITLPAVGDGSGLEHARASLGRSACSPPAITPPRLIPGSYGIDQVKWLRTPIVRRGKLALTGRTLHAALRSR